MSVVPRMSDSVQNSLVALHYDLGVKLKDNTTPQEVLDWLRRRVHTLGYELRGGFNSLETDTRCPCCNAKTEGFDYLESGMKFPAKKCVANCGWWQ